MAKHPLLQGLPYFAQAALDEERHREEQYDKRRGKCPVCGSDSNSPVVLGLNGKFPDNFSRRKLNKFDFRAERLRSILAQLERLFHSEAPEDDS